MNLHKYSQIQRKLIFFTFLFSLFSLLPLPAQVTTPLSPWRGVGGEALSFSQLLDSALHNNIAVRRAKQNLQAAHLQRREAFTNYFPTISGAAMTFAANRDMVKMDIDPSEYITPELGMALAQSLPAEALMALSSPMTMTMMKNGTIAGINAVLPIFTGGQIINGNRLARVGEDVSSLQLQLSHNDVERQLTEYFWQMVTLQEKRHTLDAVDSLLATIHADAQAAVDAGVALRNDLLQVQLRQNDIASQRLKLNNGIGLLRLIIAQFCGLATTDFTIAIPSSEVQPDYPIVNSPIANCVEFQLLEKQVTATTLQRRMEIGMHLPSLAVGAGYNYHNLFDNDRHFGMVFATLSVPVTDWWGGSLAIKRKRIAEQQAREQLDDNAHLLAIRQQKAANDVAEAQNQIQLADKSITQARENLRIHTDTYHAGTTTMSDLLEAQLLLQQSLDKRTDAVAAFHNATLAYRHATGQ